MDNLEITFIEDKYGPMTMRMYTDIPTGKENLTPDNNIRIDDETNKNKEYKKGNTDNDNTNIENVNNDDIKTENICLNKDLIIDEYPSITDNAVNNNSYNTTDDVKPNDKLSYTRINEFEMFLKEHAENYDNCYACAMASSIPNREIQQLINNNNNKFEDFEEMLDSTNLYENSEKVSLGRNIIETDGNNRNITEGTCNLDDMVNTISETDIVKPIDILYTKIVRSFDNLNTEIQFKNDDEGNKYGHTNDVDDGNNNDIIKNEDIVEDNYFIPQTDVIVEENSIISISSENSELSIDSIQLDPSWEEMEVDCFYKFEFDTDSEGYNSSDFEFINEKEACLGGIVNKSGSRIKDLTCDNKAIEEHKNFNEPGPSRVGYDRLDSDTLLRVNSINNEAEFELNHMIPEGEHLYELFAEPWATFDYQAENKAFFSNKAMHLEADDIGFNVEVLHRRHEENEVDDDIKQEAINNARKIIMMYPAENTKPRQRRF